jgi:hypothetical protein
MDQISSDHLARVHHLREAFASANERLVKRLREAEDAAAERGADGVWSAAQIGWHVASVNTRFAALIAGDVPAAKPLPHGFVEKPWAAIAAEIPEKLQAPPAAVPPSLVHKKDAVAALESSAVKMARAFDTLTAERGSGIGVTNPLVGTINLYQVGEWAIAHVARHNAQAKRVLGG